MAAKIGEQATEIVKICVMKYDYCSLLNKNSNSIQEIYVSIVSRTWLLQFGIKVRGKKYSQIIR